MICADLRYNPTNAKRHPLDIIMETSTTHLIKQGKKLSYLLRHDQSYTFDEHGWREVSDLVANHGFTMEELHEIVASNNKQRYEFSEDMICIRARQEHSIQVDVEQAEAKYIIGVAE